MDRLTIRAAGEGDSRSLFEWRNDEYTRAASGNPDEVRWDAHERWYLESLASPTRRIYVAELGKEVGMQVGMCRFDREGKVAEVSINLNPAFRGRGLARVVLREAMKAYRAEEGGAAITLTARIRPSNEASVRLFETVGFVRTRSDPDFDWFEL